MMNVGDLVQMEPPRMKSLGNTIGVVVELDAYPNKLVRVCWGTYGTVWTMKKLLKKVSKGGEIEEQSSI